jgi:hypothetical protein
MSSVRSVGALRRAALAVVCAASFASVAFAGPNPQPQQPQQPARTDEQGHRIPKVQIAILLDNSGSMEGLINQARTEIWKVVNQFSTAKQHGVAPRLELALYEYGDGVRRLQGFTSGLDRRAGVERRPGRPQAHLHRGERTVHPGPGEAGHRHRGGQAQGHHREPHRLRR